MIRDMSIGAVWNFFKEAGSDFVEDDSMTQAAAVAFYTALSFAPLLVLLLTVVTLFLGEGTQAKLVTQIQDLMGPEAGKAVNAIVNPEQTAAAKAEEDGSGDPQGVAAAVKKQQSGIASVAGLISLATLIFSASGVFAQLQAAMNTIWDVEAKPSRSVAGGAWDWVRKRLLSVGMIFAVLFILLVSLVVSSVLAGVFAGDGLFWRVLNFVVSAGVFVALFAAIFKFLPDVKIPWSAVWVGAGATAVLFAVGKWAIGLYLGRAAVGSSYGAAGSLVVLLVWVYYSSIILFLGAEMTQVYAKQAGHRITPSKHARPETPPNKRPATQPRDDGGTRLPTTDVRLVRGRPREDPKLLKVVDDLRTTSLWFVPTLMSIARRRAGGRVPLRRRPVPGLRRTGPTG